MPPACIPVWIEVNERGEANAFALNTSLAIGSGPSVHAALERLRQDLIGTRRWLAAHGVSDGHPVDLPMRVVETVTTRADPLRGGTRAFFAWDAQMPSDDDIDRIERVMHCSRADLLSLVSPASDETLDVRLAPKMRTLREMVKHIAARELSCATCLFDDPLAAPPIHEFGPDLLRRLRNVRLYFQEQGLNRIRRMDSAQRVRQFHVGGDWWSARRALRHAAQHEIHHLKQAYRMLQRIRRLPEPVRRAAVA